MFDVSSKGRVQVHRVDTWEEKYAYVKGYGREIHGLCDSSARNRARCKGSFAGTARGDVEASLRQRTSNSSTSDEKDHYSLGPLIRGPKISLHCIYVSVSL